MSSPRKEEAARKRGEMMRVMWANRRKHEVVGGRNLGGENNGSASGLREMPVIPSEPASRAEPSKREVFEALKAKLGGSPKLEVEDVPLSEVPCAPFDVVVEGEEHRVTQMGKRLGLFYVGGGEPTFARYLGEGELEKLWEKRKR